MDPHPAPAPLAAKGRLSIGEICLLVAGVGFGIWLLGIDGGEVEPYGLWIGLIGGASAVGPPLLLWSRRRERRRRWGAGELLWFSQGVSAWLLWPPIVVHRARLVRPAMMGPDSSGAICFAYGTPLMAIYVGSALLFGGWLRRGRRRRHRSWREQFGLALGVLWACTGLYVLYVVYTDR